MKKLAAEFKEFLLKQNALALAVGVIIGGALGKIVSGLRLLGAGRWPLALLRWARRVREQRLEGSGPRRVGERRPPRQRDELVLAAHPRRALGRLDALVGPVGPQPPGLDVVGEHGPEDLVEHALLEQGMLDGKGDVDAADEVARHPVARGEVDLLLAAGVEVPDAR